MTPDVATGAVLSAAAAAGQKIVPVTLEQSDQVLRIAAGQESSGQQGLQESIQTGGLAFFIILAGFMGLMAYLVITKLGMDEGPVIFGVVGAYVIFYLIMRMLRAVTV